MDHTDIHSFLHFDAPTNEQKDALDSMQEFVGAENEEDFFILCGAAGTGKTSLTSALVGYLNHKNLDYRIAAPTGRAARIIGRKTRVTASTIHALIYRAEPDDHGVVHFKLKQEICERPVIFIIDEASMIPRDSEKQQGSLFKVDNGLLIDLVSFVKIGHAKSKLVLLGDHYQLPPIGEKESRALQPRFYEVNFNFAGRSHVLTEVKRQADGSYILRSATEMRNAIDKGQHSYPVTGHHEGNIYRAARTYARKQERDGETDLVAISVSHKANKFFNDLVRKEKFGRAARLLENGDLLMVTQSWHRNGRKLNNGDHVRLLNVDLRIQEEVEGFHFTAVRIQALFDQDEEPIEDYALLECLIDPAGQIDHEKWMKLVRARYTKNKRFREFRDPEQDKYAGALRLVYGNAITCQKAQGGEWKKVYINTLGIPNLKWQYTAVTRASEDIHKF